MKIICTVLFIAFAFSGNLFSQQSTLVKLIDHVDELTKIKDDKIQQIEKLNRDIKNLRGKNALLKIDNKELKKIVQEKTEEIFIISGQLSDITYEYAKLIREVDRLGGESEQMKDLLIRMRADSAAFQKELMASNKLVTTLTDSLKSVNLKNEVLTAEVEALEDFVKEMLNEIQYVKFFEAEFNLPNAVSMNLIYGKLMKGNNLFMGGKVGYAYYWQNDLIPSYQGKIIPISFVLRSALSRKKLGFYYTNPYKKASEGPRLFYSLEAGYSISVGKIENGYYNKGGINLALGLGFILNSNENVNPYAIVGYKLQTLGYKDVLSSGENVFPGFLLTGGLYF